MNTTDTKIELLMATVQQLVSKIEKMEHLKNSKNWNMKKWKIETMEQWKTENGKMKL